MSWDGKIKIDGKEVDFAQGLEGIVSEKGMGEVIVIEGEQVCIKALVRGTYPGPWGARVCFDWPTYTESLEGPTRPTRAVAARDRDLLLAAARQMADGYVAPARPPTVATHTIVNVAGIARDRWTLGERRAEARWDADARMWRADVWGAGGHECTYWAPSAETAAAAAAAMLGEVAS